MLLIEADLSRRLLRTGCEMLRSRAMSNITNPLLLGGLSLAAGGAISLSRKERWRKFVRCISISTTVWRLVRNRK